MRSKGGRWIGEPSGEGRASVELHFATRDQPLSYRGPLICRRLAELVAPDVIPDTEFAALPLGELLRAAPEPDSRKLLARTLRVLGDGRVRAALVAMPAFDVTEIDLRDAREGSAVHRWESALVRREAPAAPLAKALSAYQSVLVVDHLLQNKARGQLLVEGRGGKLLAARGCDAFTARPVEGALPVPFERLARHVVYSASLIERLRSVTRERLVTALRTGQSEGPNDQMLVTPKELEQILERRRGLVKRVDRLVARRGAERALALP